MQAYFHLGGRNLVRVRDIVVAAIFDFMTVEDWGNCAVKENACTAGYKHAKSLFTGYANERLWVSLKTQALMAAGDFNTCPCAKFLGHKSQALKCQRWNEHNKNGELSIFRDFALYEQKSVWVPMFKSWLHI